MSIWKDPTSNPKRRPSMRGAVMLDVTHGAPRVRAWPEKRGKGGTQQQKAQREWFRHASWAIKYMEPDMVSQVMEARQGKPLLPRDMLMMMLSGRLMQITTPSGARIIPQVAITDVSQSLDLISSTPGSILYRGSNQWLATPLPTPGNVWWWSPPDISAWTVLSGDGNALTSSYDAVKGLSLELGPPVNGDVTRCAVQTIVFPAVPWSASFRMDAQLPQQNYSSCGIVLRDSIGGRLLLFMISQDGSLNVYRMNGLAGYNATSFTKVWSNNVEFKFWRVTSDGSTLRFLTSPDGITYIELHQQGRTAWLTNGPTQIGFGGFYARTIDIRNVMNVTQWQWSN